MIFRNIFKYTARSYTPIPKMPADHISTICTRPLGRIDNIVLKRIDPEPRCATYGSSSSALATSMRSSACANLVELCKRL